MRQHIKTAFHFIKKMGGKKCCELGASPDARLHPSVITRKLLEETLTTGPPGRLTLVLVAPNTQVVRSLFLIYT